MRIPALDSRVRRFVPPVRVLWATTGDAAPQRAESLLGLTEADCILEHRGGEAPGLLLDFGRELHGGIHIINGPVPSHAPTRVRIRFGESASEAMGEPNQDHAIHDQECLVPWYGQMEFGNTGFRFVRIDLVTPGECLELKRCCAVELMRPLEYQGRFVCDDERLNTIWQTGARTVHACMQDLLWDGIKRDRLVWIGDMHPEAMVISTVFGAHPIVPASLDFVRDHTPLPGWMNANSSYSLWWVLIQHVWHLYHGNTEYLAAQRDYLLPLLAQLRSRIDADGSEQLDNHRLLDWPTSEDPTALHVGLQALLSMALDAGAELCSLLDEPEEQTACLIAAQQLRTHVLPETKRKSPNALLALAGLTDAHDVNTRILAQEPLHDISTFYGYYVLEARALAGDYAGCLDVIRRYWGAMLDFGATTFWEDFDLSWTENAGRIDELPVPGKADLHRDFGNYCYKGLRHSLCHGWAAGPTAWLTRHVLGLQPLSPGCALVQVRPNLGGLEYAEGALPTPHGLVEVRHRRCADGRIETECTAPPGVRTTLDR